MSVDPLSYHSQSFLNNLLPSCHQTNFWSTLNGREFPFVNMASPQVVNDHQTNALIVYDTEENSSVARCMTVPSEKTIENNPGGAYLLSTAHLPGEYQLFGISDVTSTNGINVFGSAGIHAAGMPSMLNQVPTQRRQHYHHRHHAHAKHNQGNKTRFSATGLSSNYTVVRGSKMSLSSAPSSPNAGSVVGTSVNNYAVTHIPTASPTAYNVPQCKGSSSGSSSCSSKSFKMSTSSSSYSSCSSLSSTPSMNGISPRKRRADDATNNNKDAYCRKEYYQRQGESEIINLCSCETCATDEVTAGVDDVTLRDSTSDEFGQKQKRSKNDDDVVFVCAESGPVRAPPQLHNIHTIRPDLLSSYKPEPCVSAKERTVRKTKRQAKKNVYRNADQSDCFPFIVPSSTATFTPPSERPDRTGRYFLRSAAKGRKQEQIASKTAEMSLEPTSVHQLSSHQSIAAPVAAHSAIRAIDLNNNGQHAFSYPTAVVQQQIPINVPSSPRYHTRSQKKVKAEYQATANPIPTIVGDASSTKTHNHLSATRSPAVLSTCHAASVIQSASSVTTCKQHVPTSIESSPASGGAKEPLRSSSSFKKIYDIHGIIGVGGGGTVYAGTRKSDGVQVAIKQVPKAKVKRWGRLNDRVVPIEFELLYRASNTSHNGIIGMLDWYERRSTYILVMERPQPVIDLFDYLNQYGALPETMARSIFRQIAEAVLHCHANGVVHRDIKDENVLLNLHTSEAKLIDFGCGTVLKDAPYTEFAGTPEFYPPEWFLHRRYFGHRVDAWSLGVLLFTMVEAEVPFQKEKDIVECNLRHKHAGRLSDSCKHLISWMLQKDQQMRPTIEQALAHPWFQQPDQPSPASSGVMGTDELYEKRLHLHQNGQHVVTKPPVPTHHKVASSESPESPPRFNQLDASTFQHQKGNCNSPRPNGLVFQADRVA